MLVLRHAPTSYCCCRSQTSASKWLIQVLQRALEGLLIDLLLQQLLLLRIQLVLELLLRQWDSILRIQRVRMLLLLQSDRRISLWQSWGRRRQFGRRLAGPAQPGASIIGHV